MNIYIRNEHYENEYRSPLIPQDILRLLNKGFHFTVQESNHRVFTNQDFQDISGLTLTQKEWFEPEFQTFLILGIKELTCLEKLHQHTHCYFSHSFKQQTNSRSILSAFSTSKSILHDIEYLLDSSGNRLITFGFYAGLVGATLGLQEFILSQSKKSLENLTFWNSFEEMLASIQIPSKLSPRIAVLGSHGRCGLGVCSLLQKVNLSYSTFNTKDKIQHLDQYDIVFNCILLDTSYSQIWFSKESIPKDPTVIVDISCDYSKPNNPIPLYTQATTWKHPVYRPCDSVHILAIENLPSLLPKESSIHFSQQLTKLLLENDENVWQSNKNYFLQLISELE